MSFLGLSACDEPRSEPLPVYSQSRYYKLIDHAESLPAGSEEQMRFYEAAAVYENREMTSDRYRGPAPQFTITALVRNYYIEKAQASDPGSEEQLENYMKAAEYEAWPVQVGYTANNWLENYFTSKAQSARPGSSEEFLNYNEALKYQTSESSAAKRWMDGLKYEELLNRAAAADPDSDYQVALYQRARKIETARDYDPSEAPASVWLNQQYNGSMSIARRVPNQYKPAAYRRAVRYERESGGRAQNELARIKKQEDEKLWFISIPDQENNTSESVDQINSDINAVEDTGATDVINQVEDITDDIGSIDCGLSENFELEACRY